MTKEFANDFKEFNRGFLAGKSQATKEILEEVNKIIDTFGENRDNHNSLITIKIGEDFATNSINMFKEELKQQLKKLGEEGS